MRNLLFLFFFFQNTFSLEEKEPSLGAITGKINKNE